MLSFSIGLVVGIVLLMWSADKFVDGASSVATHMGMPRLLVGMVIVGFGTSAPELVVSALSSLEGKPGIALGNAYGSNIANIALILGVTILIRPIRIDRNIIVRELPVLLAVTLLSVVLLWDLELSRLDAVILLLVFAFIMFATIRSSMREKKRQDELKIGDNDKAVTPSHAMQSDAEAKTLLPMNSAVMWLIIGLVLLVISSQLLVWSAVGIATAFGVSEIITGLTIVAIGTSLPELAAAIAATRKNEHALVIGNILGSNFFNTLAVVGIAGLIQPLTVESTIIFRDIGCVAALTLLLWIFCIKACKHKDGVLSRYEGIVLMLTYVLYTAYLMSIVLNKPLFTF